MPRAPKLGRVSAEGPLGTSPRAAAAGFGALSEVAMGPARLGAAATNSLVPELLKEQAADEAAIIRSDAEMQATEAAADAEREKIRLARRQIQLGNFLAKHRTDFNKEVADLAREVRSTQDIASFADVDFRKIAEDKLKSRIDELQKHSPTHALKLRSSGGTTIQQYEAKVQNESWDLMLMQGKIVREQTVKTVANEISQMSDPGMRETRLQTAGADLSEIIGDNPVVNVAALDQARLLGEELRVDMLKEDAPGQLRDEMANGGFPAIADEPGGLRKLESFIRRWESKELEEFMDSSVAEMVREKKYGEIAMLQNGIAHFADPSRKPEDGPSLKAGKADELLDTLTREQAKFEGEYKALDDFSRRVSKQPGYLPTIGTAAGEKESAAVFKYFSESVQPFNTPEGNGRFMRDAVKVSGLHDDYVGYLSQRLGDPTTRVDAAKELAVLRSDTFVRRIIAKDDGMTSALLAGTRMAAMRDVGISWETAAATVTAEDEMNPRLKEALELSLDERSVQQGNVYRDKVRKALGLGFTDSDPEMMEAMVDNYAFAFETMKVAEMVPDDEEKALHEVTTDRFQTVWGMSSIGLGQPQSGGLIGILTEDSAVPMAMAPFAVYGDEEFGEVQIAEDLALFVYEDFSELGWAKARGDMDAKIIEVSDHLPRVSLVATAESRFEDVEEVETGRLDEAGNPVTIQRGPEYWVSYRDPDGLMKIPIDENGVQRKWRPHKSKSPWAIRNEKERQRAIRSGEVDLSNQVSPDGNSWKDTGEQVAHGSGVEAFDPVQEQDEEEAQIPTEPSPAAQAMQFMSQGR